MFRENCLSVKLAYWNTYTNHILISFHIFRTRTKTSCCIHCTVSHLKFTFVKWRQSINSRLFIYRLYFIKRRRKKICWVERNVMIHTQDFKYLDYFNTEWKHCFLLLDKNNNLPVILKFYSVLCSAVKSCLYLIHGLKCSTYFTLEIAILNLIHVQSKVNI